MLPSDDSLTFALIDSISSESKVVRDFYFPAFKRIISIADGALAEVVGSHIIKYVQQYPTEFSKRYECCEAQYDCCKNLTQAATLAGYEFVVNDQVTYDDLIRKITSGYRNWHADKVMLRFIETIDKVRKEK